LIVEPSVAVAPLEAVEAAVVAAPVVADEPPAAVVAAEAAVVAVVVADPDELLELSLPQAATASSDAPQNTTPSRKPSRWRPAVPPPSAPTARTFRRTLMPTSPFCGRHPRSPFDERRRL
jgi:hypothetical protein